MDDLLSRISTVLKRQDFRMCVPPESDDTDIVLEECRDAIESLRQQLAAALAACEAKDIALSQLIQHTLACEQRLNEFNGLGDLSGSGCSVDICEATQALAIQPDAFTLRQHDVALIERCAEVCEEYIKPNTQVGRQAGATRCAAAIRELKERK